jgi:hypothetical protein
MGTDQDALIFMLVEQLSGRKVLPDVWTSMGETPPMTTRNTPVPVSETPPVAP